MKKISVFVFAAALIVISSGSLIAAPAAKPAPTPGNPAMSSPEMKQFMEERKVLFTKLRDLDTQLKAARDSKNDAQVKQIQDNRKLVFDDMNKLNQKYMKNMPNAGARNIDPARQKLMDDQRALFDKLRAVDKEAMDARKSGDQAKIKQCNAQRKDIQDQIMALRNKMMKNEAKPKK